MEDGRLARLVQAAKVLVLIAHIPVQKIPQKKRSVLRKI
jgi:hypothetical protein